MEIDDQVVRIGAFAALTSAIIVLFVGKWLNQRFLILRHLYISESVSGGLLISILLALVYLAFRIEVTFDLTARSFLLVYFFTTIGINTKLPDLWATRRTFGILLVAIVAYMILQDGIAVAIGKSFGATGAEGLLAGTVALTGGRETVIGWAPILVDEFGIANAREIGVASAAFGLILGSLLGGPIARHLIERHRLRGQDNAPVEADAGAQALAGTVDEVDFLRSILAIHVCVIIGFALNQVLADVGRPLPLAVMCFMVAIGVTNTVARLLPKVSWPSQTAAMTLIAELCLGILFGMSLMSAELWVIVELPTQLLLTVMVQVGVAAALTAVVIFRILGGTYAAAVMCAGFAGLVLGSVATAMANMKAVTKHAGETPMVFIIVPLAAVVCIDAVNHVMIRLFLAWF